MPTVHSSKLIISDQWIHQDPNGVSTPEDSKTLNLTTRLDNGDGDNQAQDMFVGQFTLSTNEDHAYDLAGGVVDVFGNTLTFATIKQIYVQNLATDAGENLIVGGGPINTGGALLTSLFAGAAGDVGHYCYPSGVYLVTAPLTGFPVTGGSEDILRIFNAGTAPITYNLVIKGTR